MKLMELKELDFGSIEPLLITEDFINRFSKLEKMCHHFHLSLQSGCDETLKRMNRRYTTDEFRSIVNLLRKHISDVALTTDIIIGFPGETEEEFHTTYEFLKEIHFSKMHVFKYSPRKGTKAADFPQQVDGMTKAKRSDILISLSNQYEKKFAENYIGKAIEVLFENEEEGHTTNYIKVIDKNKNQKAGTIKTVIAQSEQNGCLYV